MFKRHTYALLSLLTLAAMNAAVPAKAQQYVAATARVAAVQPAQPARVATTAPVYYQSQYYAPQAARPQYYAPAQPAAAPVAAAQPSGDPYGFTAWLNATRASYGLGPVAHDPNLSGWAAQNNSHQSSRGMGHYVMGPARRQNSAMGNYASIGSMWMSSPAHRAALLDPSIRWIGIAGLGAYWTFNAN
jgi:uncharacterized protein YkwD